MFNLILGFIIGVILSPIAIKLFKILYKKLKKNVDELEK
jgi:hypothetical protein